MAKRIHHMGMTITKEAHDRFHGESPTLGPKQHDALMKRMGVTKEQDEEWHRTHLTLAEQRAAATQGMRRINPFAAGGSFLAWCVKQGWLAQQGKQYYATEEGVRELRERFAIEV
jgi:hypothetical protein